MFIFDVDFTILTIGGQNLSLIELLSTVSGLSCVFLATRGKVANFWVGYLYNIFLFIMFAQKHLYSSMMLQPISLAINFFGHYRWTHPKEDEKDKRQELKVTLLTNRERVAILCIIAAFTLLWGLFLQNVHTFITAFPQARQPSLDAFVTSFILLAQYLSAQKKLDCWGAWLVVNIMNSVLYISAGLVFMPLVCLGYLILAAFGFTMWRKKMKEERA